MSEPRSAFRKIPQTPWRRVVHSELKESRLLLSSEKKLKNRSPRSPSSAASAGLRKRLKEGFESATSPIRLATTGGTRVASRPNVEESEEEGSFLEMGEEDDDEDLEEGLPATSIPTVETVAPLGEGHSSWVKKVRCRENNRLYALKESKVELPNPSARDLRIAELRQWDSLRHNRIVRFLRAWQEDSRLCILMQLGEDGTLYDFVKYHMDTYNRIDSQLLLAAFRDCCSALEYMHSEQIAHLDIKPANICLSNGRALLCDMELIKRFGEVKAAETDHTYLSLEAFTLEYEVHPSADIFALGITFLELAAWIPLPKGGDQHWRDLRNRPVNVRDYAHLQNHPLLADLIAKCMRPEWASRPTARDLLTLLNLPDEVRLLPPPEFRRLTFVDNRPASASSFLHSPRDSGLSQPTGAGLTFASFPSLLSTSPVQPSPPLSRSVSRGQSPITVFMPRRLDRSLLSPSPQQLEVQVDEISDQLTTRAVVTPRPSGGMTPSMLQGARATSPRPFASNSPLVFHTAS